MKKILLAGTLLFHLLCLNAQVEPPTMGWSSWNTFSVNISEDIIKGQADAMVSQGLKDAGYLYINIDDGFQYGRTAQGKVRIHPQRFPRGLKVVSDYIHSKGLKAGIYSDAGDCTCGSISNGDTKNTNVGFYGYEQVDADFYFKELNFDFIKVDYCGGNHAGLNEQEQYTAIHDAIVATGKDVRYNLCRWAYPGTWCHDISTSWRTTGDIYDGWASVKGILAENLYLSAYCYDGCYNDMDMLEVGRSMTEEEDKTHFGMWCIMSSPLLIGCNMATIKERPLALLKNAELIALNQDPLGLQAYVVQHIGETYILAKDILSLHGTTRAVALYNPSDREEQIQRSRFGRQGEGARPFRASGPGRGGRRPLRRRACPRHTHLQAGGRAAAGPLHLRSRDCLHARLSGNLQPPVGWNCHLRDQLRSQRRCLCQLAGRAQEQFAALEGCLCGGGR